MKRQSLTTLLLVAAFGTSAGCASSGKSHFWAKPFASNRTVTAEDAVDKESTPVEKKEESAIAALKKSFSRNKSEQDELSPEFIAAQKTLKKNPEKTLLAWARYQEDIGEYAEARRKYRELQIAYPDNLESHLGMARIEMLTGRSKQAEQILTDLVKEHPDSTAVRISIGQMYAQQEKWDEAIRAFEEACEIDPENQDCRYELGVAFARVGNYDQAISNLSFSVGEPAAHYNIGYILHEQGRDADAAEWFQNALSLHPDHQTAEKSKAMLAKLSPDPTSRGVVTTPMVARKLQPNSPPSSQPVAATNSQSRRSAPAEDLPIISGTRKKSGHVDFTSQPSPSGFAQNETASHEYPPHSVPEAHGTSGHYLDQNYTTPEKPASQSSPFRNVSYTEPPVASEAPGVGSQPPQWRGPSPQSVSRPATSQWSSAPKDPPNWRARKN
ncbi:MAG: tetratricopeptide repeat protein [Planctomycetaceae bacterium]